MSTQKTTIERAQSGNGSSFGKLYDEYIKKIYNFIYYKTHHKETAEDLTSITFAKALKNIQTYDSAKGSFSSWLYKIARNTVIDHYRTQKSHYNIEDAWDLSGDSDVALDVDNKMKIQQIKEYIKELKSTERDIVIMRVWQEMSYREIAEVLDKSEASCKMAFSRTLAQLKKNMPIALFIALLLYKI